MYNKSENLNQNYFVVANLSFFQLRHIVVWHALYFIEINEINRSLKSLKSIDFDMLRCHLIIFKHLKSCLANKKVFIVSTPHHIHDLSKYKKYINKLEPWSINFVRLLKR